MARPKLTDPKEFAIIRSMYFAPATPRLKELDQEELDSRWVAKRKNNKNQSR